MYINKSRCEHLMAKIKLFIDFDDTLFDRNAFRDDLFAVMGSLGPTEAELKTSYQAVYADGYAGPMAQLTYINENIEPIDLAVSKQKIDGFLADTSKYLYPKSIEFLESIDRTKYCPNLLTVGGVEFQKAKVCNSGIEKYFDECYYSAENKAKALRNLVDLDEKFILIDDKDRELSKVAENFENAIVIKAEPEKLLGSAEGDVTVPGEGDRSVTSGQNPIN